MMEQLELFNQKPVFDEEKMILEVQYWLSQESPRNRADFINTSKSGLFAYHHTLGQRIRNEFKLWTYKWEEKLINGVDCSENHPDAISMRIIKEVWNREQNK